MLSFSSSLREAWGGVAEGDGGAARERGRRGVEIGRGEPMHKCHASVGRHANTDRVRQVKTSRPASSSRSCWAMTMPLSSPT